MAAVLKCPDCGHRHPLDKVTTREVFRCEECGRALKVPESLRTAPVDAPAPARPVGRGVTARPMPAQGPGTKLLPPLHADAPEAELAPLGWGWRLLIWVLAIPIGAAGGGLLANALGLVTLSQLEDTMLGSGYRRFDPLMRFVPMWALVTALFVTVVVAGVEALRRRRVEHGVRSPVSEETTASGSGESSSDASGTATLEASTDPAGVALSARPSRAGADTEPSDVVVADDEAEPADGADLAAGKLAGGADPDDVARSDAD